MNEAPLDQLQVSLERAISRWMDVRAAEDGPWSAVGYVGDNTSRLMACAAMSVLRATTDLNQYFEREDLIK